MTNFFEPVPVELSDGREIVIHEAIRRQPSEFALGAYHEGELIGIVVCEPDSAKVGHLALVVRPEWRHLGVGRALFRQMLRRAADLELGYLRFSYHVGNQAAARLAGSREFVVARRVRDDLVIAAVLVPSDVGTVPVAA